MLKPSELEWRPSANRQTLQARQQLMQQIRTFFVERDVLEVETPILNQAPVSDPNIEPLQVIGQGYLHTSPEYAMKRLLCDGIGDIFQICKVFRSGEAGRRHNPEFSMLEWYRVGWNHHHLMVEVAELARVLLAAPEAPIAIFSYREAGQHHAGLDVMTASDAEVAACGISCAGQDLQLDRDGWLDVIVSHQVELALPADTLVFLHDFPATQAALAQVRQTERGPVAERFELFYNGMELANGYHELTDAAEQRQRFEREANGRPLDERLLAAMAESGLPECAGVAMGLDRILMHRLELDTIQSAISFDASRA